MQQGLFFPNPLLENKELTWTEKVIIVRIKAEITQKGECRLRNEDFAEVAGVRPPRIAQCLTRLEKKNYIERIRDGHRRRHITLTEKSS